MKIYHIPICPFSQRLEILLELKGCRDQVDFQVVDITVPRPDWLLAKTRGTTALPVLETEQGRILKESLVLMDYLEQCFPERPVARPDPDERALERMLTLMEREFAQAGYALLMNRDPARRTALHQQMQAQYARLHDFLQAERVGSGPFLFEHFGWAEAVFTPLFVRFQLLDYYEDFRLPDSPEYACAVAWQTACLAHPAAQQVSREEVIKLYYDYTQGAGNAALLPGRHYSSFAFEPHWQQRPWPPRDKYGPTASDQALGLTSSSEPG
jgi:glutathione S-transferase